MLQSRMRRGMMDRQITLIKGVKSTNTYQEDKFDSWVAVDTNPIVWARMRTTRGREVVIEDRIQLAQETIFTIDYRADIDIYNNRVVFNSVPYNIISIAPTDESRGMYLDLVCSIIHNELWT